MQAHVIEAREPVPPEAASSDTAAWPPFRDVVAPLQVPCWDSDALVPPAVAQAWARVLVMYWSRAERLGALDLAQPLYVLDLAPGGGTLAARMLAALHDELAARGQLGWPVRYLLCPQGPEPAAVAARLMQAPALRPFAVQGWLERATWQARTGHPLLLGASRFPLFGARNPVVALAAGNLSALPADLYCAHYGELLLGRAVLQPPASETGGPLLDCAWRALEPVDEPVPCVAVLLEHYRASLISAPVLLSEPALALADALADLGAGRYLLLAADSGVAAQQQIQLGALALPQETPDGRLQLPVNFHALALHQESGGARVANLEAGGSGLVLHMACRDAVAGLDEAGWQAMTRAADAVHPADRWGHVNGAPVQSLEEMNFRLRSAGFDPLVLGAMLQGLGHLDGSGLQVDDVTQASLRRSLALSWERAPAPLRSTGLGTALADLLLHLGDWALLRDVLHDVPLAPADAAHRQVQLALLDAATGRTAAGLAGLQRLLAYARDEQAQELQDLLHQRLARWRASPWYLPDDMRDGDLCLELLDALHVPGWLHQYRDEHIACIAGLPPLATPDDAMRYLERVQHGGSAEYALVHAQHGLVGAVGVRRLGDMAHVHFWIGVDHQGRGLGGQALRLLLRCVAAVGVQHVFTSVYRGNLRSRRILDRTGFVPVAHDAQGDDANFEFLHLAPGHGGTGAPPGELAERLVRMCAAIGEPLVSAHELGGQAAEMHQGKR